MHRFSLVLLILVLSVHSTLAQSWSTYRANSQRTANADGKPGPQSPKILWALKSKDHYIASPVPTENKLFISGLGAFNVGTFFCLSTEPKANQRVLWFKSTPYLKLPTVSSPAVVDGRVIFGDGMHQTDGATLHCLDTAGLPLWQYSIPGTLVHLEGSPAVAEHKAFIGGGSAGVVCIDTEKVTVAGKPMDLKSVQKLQAQRWQEMLAKYEKDKKTDAFALPPSEDQLPKAEPAKIWQEGQEKWHIDAPVALIGDKLLVGSAFLDKEKTGDRAIFCLDAKSGKAEWRSKLKLNPWGGPSVVGSTVIVTGSSIGYDPKVLKGAKGTISAFDLKDGKELWSKDITGAVVGCAAIAEGSAIVTATDGKVRAFDLTSGERRWIYDAKMPMFAPPAIAGDLVYVGDLKGAIHAIDLKTGGEKWILDLGSAPETKSPGMIYAGPVVQSGRLYVATCNLEGPFARQGTVVVCIGEK